MDLPLSKQDLLKLKNYVQGCVPVYANQLKVGDYVLLDGIVCKVTHFSLSKPARHRYDMALIQATNISTLQKSNCKFHLKQIIMSPTITDHQYQLLDLNEDNFSTILLNNGSLQQNIKIQNEQFITLIKKALIQSKQIFVNITKAIGKQMVTKVSIKQEEKMIRQDK